MVNCIFLNFIIILVVHKLLVLVSYVGWPRLYSWNLLRVQIVRKLWRPSAVLVGPHSWPAAVRVGPRRPVVYKRRATRFLVSWLLSSCTRAIFSFLSWSRALFSPDV